MSNTFHPSFLRRLPKTDLHVHLDGSLRLSTLIELARDQHVKLPSFTEAGLKELVFKAQYKNLPEYLEGFRYTVAAMQTPQALERVAYELALDNFAEGVRYIEPRFGPQLHLNGKMTMCEVFESVRNGLLCAQREINARPEIANGSEPPFHFGIIACALRMVMPQFSEYYASLWQRTDLSTDTQRFSAASLELAQECVKLHREHGMPIVGFDLAGAEHGHSVRHHAEAFEYAAEFGLGCTVHAGEAAGPESIADAIAYGRADRIGHGTHLYAADRAPDGTLGERQKYCGELAEYLRSQRIPIEVNLTSNLQTLPELQNDAGQHPLGKMVADGLAVTLCTDNRLVSHTTVTDELHLAAKTFGWDAATLRRVVLQGFECAFFTGNTAEKRAYVEQVARYYDLICSS